jgi:proline dehydrogenase
MERRWTCRDLNEAVARCRTRNGIGIRCSLHPLAEYAGERGQVDTAYGAYLGAIEAIEEGGANASIAVKLSALGLAFDDGLCRSIFASLLRKAREHEVVVEVDMEGRDMVARTLSITRASAREGHPLTLSLQAYLDRTEEDISAAISEGIAVRVVKGAYLGDTADFRKIQERFKGYAETAASLGGRFLIGTHDPDLISWAEQRFSRQELEFGFLMGLADETKRRLAKEGWQVAEYVPYGEAADAYTYRRERYLDDLIAAGRSPAP